LKRRALTARHRRQTLLRGRRAARAQPLFELSDDVLKRIDYDYYRLSTPDYRLRNDRHRRAAGCGAGYDADVTARTTSDAMNA